MLKLKLQYFGPLMWSANSLEKTLMLRKTEGRRRGWQRMRWLNGITDSMDMSLSTFREIVKGREAWHAAAHGVAKSQTWLSNWTTTTKGPWEPNPVRKGGRVREVSTGWSSMTPTESCWHSGTGAKRLQKDLFLTSMNFLVQAGSKECRSGEKNRKLLGMDDKHQKLQNNL